MLAFKSKPKFIKTVLICYLNPNTKFRSLTRFSIYVLETPIGWVGFSLPAYIAPTSDILNDPNQLVHGLYMDEGGIPTAIINYLNSSEYNRRGFLLTTLRQLCLKYED